ncbi:MAG: hypothetical protein MHM6MM_003235 [Cercozoa sp. M6MM]
MALSAPVAFVITGAANAAMLALAVLARKRGISRHTSRKLMHLWTGPVFVLCWPLFDETAYGWVAAVPLVSAVVFALVGSGRAGRYAAQLVDTVSRSGHRQELLEGPLLYGIVHACLPLLYGHRNAPSAVHAVVALCIGDGVADIFGRSATLRLPWNKRKSVRGTTSFFLASVLVQLVLGRLLLFELGSVPVCVTLVSMLSSALAESLISTAADNVIVPLVALFVSHLLLSMLGRESTRLW